MRGESSDNRNFVHHPLQFQSAPRINAGGILPVVIGMIRPIPVSIRPPGAHPARFGEPVLPAQQGNQVIPALRLARVDFQ